jgi:hypothetical protein
MTFKEISPKINIDAIKMLGHLNSEQQAKKIKRDKELEAIIKGDDERLLLIIGPCSSDNEEAVLEWMLRQGDSIELISSIGTSGYSSAEPLLVTKITGNSSKYIVIEGNRRLAALKLLQNPSLAPIKTKSVQEAVNNAINKPIEIPSIEYSKREDAFAYLGYRHIAGIKAWGPLQKARYIFQLFQYYKRTELDDAQSFSKIAKVAATNVYTAKKALTTLALYEFAKESGYWDIEKINSLNINFAVLGTVLNHSSLVKFIGLENATDYSLKKILLPEFKELFRWLFATEVGDKSRVPESRQLSILAKVVSSSQALKVFRAGRTLQEAVVYTDEANENFQIFINKALEQIKNAEDLVHLVKPTEIHLEFLRELKDHVNRLGLSLKNKMISKDEF